jgi:hypothetical protein
MATYLDKIQESLRMKTGKPVSSLDYKQSPNGGKECYNTSLVIGNINLIAGRFKTEKEADILVRKFINLPLP